MPPKVTAAALVLVLLIPQSLWGQASTWGASAHEGSLAARSHLLEPAASPSVRSTEAVPTRAESTSYSPAFSGGNDTRTSVGYGTAGASAEAVGRVVPAAFSAPASSASPSTANVPAARLSAESVVAAVPGADSASRTQGGFPIPPPGRTTVLPLAPPERSGRADSTRTDGVSAVVTVISSLAVVLGIFFAVAWCMRRGGSAGTMMLPSGVFEVLGRAPMAARQYVYLLRCGAKLVLVSVTPAGAETLTEIVDPTEVDHLAGLCRQARPDSATAVFRQVFHQFADVGRGSEARDA